MAEKSLDQEIIPDSPHHKATPLIGGSGRSWVYCDGCFENLEIWGEPQSDRVQDILQNSFILHLTYWMTLLKTSWFFTRTGSIFTISQSSSSTAENNAISFCNSSNTHDDVDDGLHCLCAPGSSLLIARHSPIDIIIIHFCSTFTLTNFVAVKGIRQTRHELFLPRTLRCECVVNCK